MRLPRPRPKTRNITICTFAARPGVCGPTFQAFTTRSCARLRLLQAIPSVDDDRRMLHDEAVDRRRRGRSRSAPHRRKPATSAVRAHRAPPGERPVLAGRRISSGMKRIVVIDACAPRLDQFDQLQGRALAHVVHVLLVGERRASGCVAPLKASAARRPPPPPAGRPRSSGMRVFTSPASSMKRVVMSYSRAFQVR